MQAPPKKTFVLSSFEMSKVPHCERKSQGVWDVSCMHCLFKMDNQQGPTVQHRKLCSMFCGSLDGGEFGGECMHVYV